MTSKTYHNCSRIAYASVEYIKTVTVTMKKRSEETQTLRDGCSKAEPKILAPPQTPSRGRGMAKI